jgi:IS1 family transposase
MICLASSGVKKRVYLMTLVDRTTRCIVGWAVAYERSEAIIQAILDGGPPAQHYFSDAFPLYEALVYPTQHQSIAGKREIYSVEGVNADLRHYLARASRCFSRCIEALRTAFRLFVFTYNRRQLPLRRYPAYPAHLLDFVSC